MKTTDPATVTLTINGQETTVPYGTSILDAARGLGVHVPTLCEHPWIHRLASCRLCIVRVEGLEKPVASCTTMANEGMVVTTYDDELHRMRQTQLQFILLNHPLDCPVCDKAGECRLQDLTYELGVENVPYRARVGEQKIDTLSPLIERNDERCIRCGRCVAVCREVQAVSAYVFEGRGYNTRINTFDGGPLDCEFCGQCVAICPVGALLTKQFKNTARVWDLKPVETVCGYCGAGCQIEMHVRRNKVFRVTSDVDTTTNWGRLCIRGRFGWDILRREDRPTTPLIRRDGELVPLSWEEALESMAEGIRHALATGGPEAVGALAGSRLPVEDAYALAYTFGAVIGTRRVAISGQDEYGEAMKTVHDRFGRPGSTATFADLRRADAVFIFGSDLAAEMPVPHLDVIAAVREDDARLIQAHPVPTKLDDFATVKLPYRPGAQRNLLVLLLKSLVENKLQNVRFIHKNTKGFAAFKSALDRLDAAALAEQAGLDLDAVAHAAGILAAAERPVVVLGAQALSGRQARDICGLAIDLLMVLGKVGKGLLLSTDRSNLYGSMLAGLVPGRGPGLATYEHVPEGWPRLPEEPGMGYEGIIEAGMAGRLSALITFGANPLVQAAKAEPLGKAMEVTGFVVACDTFLTATARKAHLFLPVAAAAERSGTYVSAEGRVLKLRRAVEPPEGVWTEWRILAELARLLDGEPAGETLAELWDKVSVDVPDLAAAAAKSDGRRGALLPRLQLDEDVKLDFGKIPEPIEAMEGDLILVCGPVLYHNGTLSTYSPAIAEVCAAPWLEMHPEDAADRELAEGDIVCVGRDNVELDVPLRFNPRLARGLVFAPSHFEEFPVGRLLENCACAPVTVARHTP
ncbi:MAG: molybdopterin-dependent oxidoreductase [Candidatus Lernaella stagnicola]|nr:molybdopterin-dependent oxidoreductase [Candidatus Lernaella stagnicola]